MHAAAGDILKDKKLYLEVLNSGSGGWCYYSNADQSVKDDKEVLMTVLLAVHAMTHI
jgi:hypothetical protein